MIGWVAAALACAAVLTAWLDTAAEHSVFAVTGLWGGVWLARQAIRREHVRVNAMAYALAGCAVWAGAQAAAGLTAYRFATWNAASAFTAVAALFVMAFNGFRDPEQARRFQSACMWFGTAFALCGLLQWYSGDGRVFWLFRTEYGSEVAGTFLNRDHFSAFMELLLPVALAASIREEPGWAPAAAGAMFASVIACGSRAGAVVVCAEVLLFVVLACTRKTRNYRAAALVLASVAACTAAGGWTFVLQRFAAGDPFAFRREMLQATAEMIRARPFEGHGLGTWPFVYPAFAVFDPPGVFMNHAHNDWAEWGSEGGVLFVLLPAGFAAAAASVARKRLWAIGVPAVCAHALVDFPLHKPAILLAVVLVAGAASASLTSPGDRAAGAQDS